MFVPSIKFCGAVLCLACLLFSGCSQQGTTSEPAAPAEEAAPVEEKTPAYITAADDFSNLALDNAETPVYDRYTLAQRRAKGLPTALPKIAPYRDKKVAYLTFDDGPDDKNTAAVLDILKQEGVKATFYVLGKNVKAYPETTKRIFDEGHALGNHSYDHDYKRLYASAESYLAEMEQADEAIYELLGLRPLITRAPSGRMGNFTSAYENIITANGYVEHDWNVSSADAAPNHPVAQDFIDNKDYLRYMGELEIIKKSQPADKRSNVVGRVTECELFMLKYITPGRKFSFQFA